MTPEGAILGRPASTVRAGEERWIARRLADLGIPIARTVRGQGTFEGADAMWLDATTVLVGRGLRTNAEGAAQVAATLGEMGVETIVVDMPWGTMHLMGMSDPGSRRRHRVARPPAVTAVAARAGLPRSSSQGDGRAEHRAQLRHARRGAS